MSEFYHEVETSHGYGHGHSHDDLSGSSCDISCKISEIFNHSHSSHNHDHKHETLMLNVMLDVQETYIESEEFHSQGIAAKDNSHIRIDRPPIT